MRKRVGPWNVAGRSARSLQQSRRRRRHFYRRRRITGSAVLRIHQIAQKCSKSARRKLDETSTKLARGTLGAPAVPGGTLGSGDDLAGNLIRRSFADPSDPCGIEARRRGPGIPGEFPEGSRNTPRSRTPGTGPLSRQTSEPPTGSPPPVAERFPAMPAHPAGL